MSEIKLVNQPIESASAVDGSPPCLLASVSVNGNAFALANADVAVVSKNLGCLRPLAVKFAELGKSGLLAHITDNTDSLAEEGVFVNDRNPALRMLSGKMRGDLKGEKAIIN